MIYIKLRLRDCRLGNWLLWYAAAKCRDPQSEVTFVLVGHDWADDPRKYAELWPSVRYEFCEGDNCDACKKCAVGLGWNAGFDPVVVRAAIKCPEGIRSGIYARFGEVLRRGAVSIGVRRGDYLRLPHTHPFVGRKYLDQAVRRFPSGSEFIVCSDDIPWCKRFFTSTRFPGMQFHFSGGGGVLEDLFLPSFCEHNIISNSTYNWWGAYLNPNPQKRVVCPSKWFGIAIRKGVKQDRLLFDECEVVKNPYSVGLWLQAVCAWAAYSTVAWIRRLKRRLWGARQ